MRMNIDILAYKIESFDSDAFREDVISHGRTAIIVAFNISGVWIDYKSEGISLPLKKIKFIRFHKWRKLDHILYPFAFITDNLRIAILLISALIKYKVKVMMVENTYVAAMSGILRKCGLVEKMIYVPGDWLVNSASKKGLRSWLGCNIAFPLCDYLACKFSDVTLHFVNIQKELRIQYWGRPIAKSDIVTMPRLKLKRKATDATTKRSMLFVGDVRENSGLDIAIESLRELRKDLDISLKIIGAPNINHRVLLDLARRYDVDKYVQFMGFVDRQKFNEVLSDCFCGINLITIDRSHSAHTLPAKIFDYLQYGMPVIATRNVGAAAGILETNKLGVVIGPDVREFTEAVREIWNNHGNIQENIYQYIRSTSTSEYIRILTGQACVP